MKWIKSRREELSGIKCIDHLRDDWCIEFAVRDYTPTEEDMQGEFQPDCEYLAAYTKGEPTTWDLQQLVLKAQEEYDKSDEVNCFYINGEKAWMDKDTRVGLQNSMNALEQANINTYTVWFNGKSYTASINTFRQVLGAVERYAMQCYAVTEQHKSAISNIGLREDYLTYQIHTGYPEKLSFALEQE